MPNDDPLWRWMDWIHPQLSYCCGSSLIPWHFYLLPPTRKQQLSWHAPQGRKQYRLPPSSSNGRIFMAKPVEHAEKSAIKKAAGDKKSQHVGDWGSLPHALGHPVWFSRNPLSHEIGKHINNYGYVRKSMDFHEFSCMPEVIICILSVSVT